MSLTGFSIIKQMQVFLLFFWIPPADGALGQFHTSAECFGKAIRVGPLRFLRSLVVLYTRPDVPREFYPRRSAGIHSFPPTPTHEMRYLRGDRGEERKRGVITPPWI